MHMVKVSGILVENAELDSIHLGRTVKVDAYLPRNVNDPSQLELLLINDGQDLPVMSFSGILEELYASGELKTPLLCVGIHCGPERKMEYGISSQADYKGRGAKAALYSAFIFEELLPYISKTYAVRKFRHQYFAGFSLGGLTALDIVWQHPGEFSGAGVFSGSLWWRMIDQEDEEYDDHTHRIMHQLVRNGKFFPGLKFFFQCGNMDETRDRNKNGIIDSIDDTLDLIQELELKGYRKGMDIRYLELKDGKHDVPTWGRAMPEFLKWIGS